MLGLVESQMSTLKTSSGEYECPNKRARQSNSWWDSSVWTHWSTSGQLTWWLNHTHLKGCRITTLQKWWPYFCLQGPEHCSSLNFGLGSSGPVLGISGSELEAGVEYTFKLTISKDGMAPESTTQTVSAHIHLHILIRMHAFCWRFLNKINLRAHRMINGIERRKTIIVLLHKWVVWSFTALNFEPYTDID